MSSPDRAAFGGDFRERQGSRSRWTCSCDAGSVVAGIDGSGPARDAVLLVAGEVGRRDWPFGRDHLGQPVEPRNQPGCGQRRGARGIPAPVVRQSSQGVRSHRHRRRPARTQPVGRLRTRQAARRRKPRARRAALCAVRFGQPRRSPSRGVPGRDRAWNQPECHPKGGRARLVSYQRFHHGRQTIPVAEVTLSRPVLLEPCPTCGG